MFKVVEVLSEPYSSFGGSKKIYIDTRIGLHLSRSSLSLSLSHFFFSSFFLCLYLYSLEDRMTGTHTCQFICVDFIEESFFHSLSPSIGYLTFRYKVQNVILCPIRVNITYITSHRIYTHLYVCVSVCVLHKFYI